MTSSPAPRALRSLALRGVFALTLIFGHMSVPTVARAAGAPAWELTTLAEPTNFSASNPAGCSSVNPGACDSYVLVVRNSGAEPTSGSFTITDHLPLGVIAEEVLPTANLVCEAGPPVRCSTAEAIVPGGTLVVRIFVKLEGVPAQGTVFQNQAGVEGGGAPAAASATGSNTVSTATPPFGVTAFGIDVTNSAGETYTQAGGHPYAVTTHIGFPTVIDATGGKYVPVEHVRDIVVDLPPGFVGDPEATPKCPAFALVGGTGVGESGCPPDSQIGTVTVEQDLDRQFGVRSNTEFEESGIYPVYNVVPEKGYPAEFGFNYQGQPVLMYAGVNPVTDYGVRVSVPGVIRGLGIVGTLLTFWGTPADSSHTPLRQVKGERVGGAGSSAAAEALLTNPTSCAAGPETAKVSVDSWENPGVYASRETTVYPRMTGCEGLAFGPSLSVAPMSAAVDEPSAYAVSLGVPQGANEFPELATPHVKQVAVTLPAGVSLSPSAANGLDACSATGPEGINLDAEEVGEGHPGGNGSPYDDGLLHPEPGHCPAGSQIATAEVETPLLPPHSLTARLFLARPACGGQGQAECSAASATNGQLFGTYLEIEGVGVRVKLRGAVSANPGTGQLTATFAQTPQLPFSSLVLQTNGGPRAPLANPQSCGPFTSESDIVPWSQPITPDATPTSAMTISGCLGQPFAPTFEAGSTGTGAATSTPFTATVARRDGEQDLAAISVRTPPGLEGMISQVPLCQEPQASDGTCGEQSRIGTTTVAAGAGSLPLWLSGRVYLTGPYNGAPFGLSIVVPAKAGPFNLGNVVVRAAIDVDPVTAAITVTSARLPEIRDGVPFRLRTVNVTIDRPGFMVAPTNCEAQTVAATLAGSGGATAGAQSPYAVSGCRELAFKPTFTASTTARTSRLNGAGLDVKVSFRNPGEANIRAVKVDLPLQLPSRLTTLQKACPVQTFDANPSSCPSQSVVGIAKARTPLLGVPLTGPAYLVSHANESFPSLVIVLQGEGVRVDLTGQTDIKHGITSSYFRAVPDVPVAAFELYLPTGRYSALAANGSLCRSRLAMPTMLLGQDGAVLKQTTTIAVSGCPKRHQKRAHRSSAHPGGRR